MATPRDDQLLFVLDPLRYGSLAAKRQYLRELLPPTLARSSVGTAIGRDGLAKSFGVDVPRIQYEDLDGDGVREAPCILLEGGRTNIVENATFEADIVGVATQSATAAQDGTHAFHGTQAVKCTTTNVAYSGLRLQTRAGSRLPVTAGTTYTLSGWLYVDAANAGKHMKVGLDWWDATTQIGAGSTASLVLVAGWQRLIFTGAAPTGAVGAYAMFRDDTAEGSWDFWLDLPQLEAAAFASSPVPSATAALVRQADTLTYTVPIIPDPAGLTIYVRMRRPEGADATGNIGQGGLVTIGAFPTDPCVDIGMLPTTRTYSAIVRDAAGVISRRDTSIPAGATLELACQIKNFATAPALALDAGDGAGYSAFQTGAGPITAFSDQSVRLGWRLNNEQMFGALRAAKIARGLFTLAEMRAA